MPMFRGKKIILGVTGSIAAYKSAFLVRLLVKEGAEVRVVMTPAAHNFITPLTLSTLSNHPVSSVFFDRETGAWESHVEFGLWADVMIVAPATANTLAKFAGGLCDNLLSAVYLSSKCPVIIAPAMDLDMYRHPATTKNIEILKQFGNTIIDTGYGELASGLIGAGRMAEPEDIVKVIQKTLNKSLPLKNKKALVTAGPTYEAIDPVRFIGNRSSGKMGFAIAEQLSNLGAKVTLISGPTAQIVENPDIHLIYVQSAAEMFEQSKKFFPKSDIAVLAAAVADYKPIHISKEKIKKKDDNLVIELEKTHDIAAQLGKIKKQDQIIAGFALETQNELENAAEKLKSKNFDLIILNSLRDKGAGFEHDTNKITILDKNKNIKKFGLKSKKEVASDIVQAIMENLHD